MSCCLLAIGIYVSMAEYPVLEPLVQPRPASPAAVPVKAPNPDQPPNSPQIFIPAANTELNLQTGLLAVMLM